jgi:hypothetical protein
METGGSIVLPSGRIQAFPRGNAAAAPPRMPSAYCKMHSEIGFT